ncbi:MAG: hydrogenase formation protein HypD [Thermoplasmata archaeon]|nr:hydrogenase formation protein HypD [Thermoplasmata archaeon]
MLRLRDRQMADMILQRISLMNVQLTFMHVCGTHQDTLVRFGLLDRLSEVGIDVRQGPGCPVCVTLPQEIDEVLALARAGKTITVFGDAVRVPGTKSSLMRMKGEGADVRIVYGIDDAVEIAKHEEQKEVVFFAIGFETTAPTTAAVAISDTPENFSILSTHRVLPPALDAIVELGEVKLHGLIEPGHVSAIIGVSPYEFLSKDFRIPQVVAGFEPIDVLMGAYMLAKQNIEGRAEVENEYRRVVRPEGNPKALGLLEKVFKTTDVAWRGFSVIKASRLDFKKEFSHLNAREKYHSILGDVDYSKYHEVAGCKCGELLRGLSTPEECPLFGTKCIPDNPIGPCMVSREGSCNISFKYRKLTSK